MSKLKIALVHDYLREYGGAERVLESLHEMYPDAPVYVGFVDWKSLGIHADRFKGWDIRETQITKLPFYKKLFSPYRIFARQAFEKLDLSDFDVVISSSNAYMAKAVLVPNGKHICYCHTPPRSLYGYSTKSDWKKNPFMRVGGGLINHFMRMWDFEVAQKVDLFVANSEETRSRIKKFYRRDSQVVYPPISFGDQTNSEKKQQKKSQNKIKEGFYYLYVNRLALAKHPELAVKAALNLGLELKVVGSGPMLEDLKSLAGDSSKIDFLGAVSDEELNKLYSGAKALLYPVEDEDFGMIPVEAMGYGVPVIAHNSGGPKETIQDQKTGILFDQLTESDLIKAIQNFQKLDSQNKFDSKYIKTQTKKYSKENFQKNILQLIKKV